MMSVQVCELATTPATREKAVATDITEGSTTHSNMAEEVFDRDLIDLWPDIPPLLPPSSKWTETVMPDLSPERAPRPELSPEEANKYLPSHLLCCRLAAPPWLLAPSSPPWPGSALAPLGFLIPPAPPWSFVAPAPLRSHLFHLGPPEPPCHPGSLARHLHLGLPCHLLLCRHPSSFMAPPSVDSTVGRHHACGLGSTWILLLQVPPVSVWSALVPPVISLALFVVLLPDARSLPEPRPKIPSMPPSVVIVVYGTRTHLPGGGR
ncbi:hypothetical protein M9458_017923 [Cirrhinus mrigala]|uniref:Uncharacterized protein n=1 Tax=Cirrhinus mrigala TaxID=683832 RepID=A0ABD0QJM6_CIRMR